MNNTTDIMDQGSSFEEFSKRFDKKHTIIDTEKSINTFLFPSIHNYAPKVSIRKNSSEKYVKVVINIESNPKKEFIREINAKLNNRALPTKYLTY